MAAMRLLLLFLLVFVMFAQVPDSKIQRTPPEQPIPFSHKAHVSQGLKCTLCHTMPDPGDFATYPKTATCMGCHTAVKKDSPHIAKLAQFHADGKNVPWARVYRIPDYVFFNHAKHVAVEGVTCQTCHGPVQEREVMRREKELNMQTCMECHRLKMANNGCTNCHEQR